MFAPHNAFKEALDFYQSNSRARFNSIDICLNPLAKHASFLADGLNRVMPKCAAVRIRSDAACTTLGEDLARSSLRLRVTRERQFQFLSPAIGFTCFGQAPANQAIAADFVNLFLGCVAMTRFRM
jgi:hypothetical protein